LSDVGKSSKADCSPCASDRSTGTAEGNIDSTACVCKRTDYYTNIDGSCLLCPDGADCSAKDGLTLLELTAKPGFWRPSVDSDIFSPCSKGHRGLGAQKIALDRCCYVDEETSNTSICSTLNLTNEIIDAQCAAGFAGPLCLVCAGDYVMMGGSCTECEGGASFVTAMLPMVGASTLLFLLVLLFLMCSGSSRKAELKRSRSMAQMRRLKKANKMVGQIKILLSFVQIFSSLPDVLDSVPWPTIFLQISLPLGIFNLNFLSVLSESSCGVSVPFYDRFILHMLLPVFCLVMIVAAFLTARSCSKKEKQVLINETTSKVVILVVLLLFPGLSTKVFQMFKCQKIDGIALPLLVQDFNVTCFQGDHTLFITIAIAFLGLYILGIPLIMFMLLWRNRKHLHDESSPKHHWVKTALGGLYVQYEADYWWFELMILFNKTMMCGGLAILSPGSPIQVLCAILIMLIQLLFLLKLAPYVKNTEDWSSFLSTLGLCLMSLGALCMKLQLAEDEMKMIEVITTVLPCLCIVVVVSITVLLDFGLKQMLCGSKKSATKDSQASLAQVQPIQSIKGGGNADDDSGELASLRSWGNNNKTRE